MAYATVAEFREYLDQIPANAVQRVEVRGAPTGGTFTLTYEGVASSAIAYSALASTVQAALVAVSSIGAGGVMVVGPAGGPWLVTFKAAIANSASLLALGTNSLTGGTTPTVRISVATDAAIQRVLARATAIINTELDFSFGDASRRAETVYGDDGVYLVPPRFEPGTVETVTAPTGYDVPTWGEHGEALAVVDADGVIPPPRMRDELLPSLRWRAGVPYVVTAVYGRAAVPDDIVECCLEIAVRIWRARDAGFSDVIGVEGTRGGGLGSGGEVAYTGALPRLVRLVLDRYRAKAAAERSFGVW